MIEVSPVALVVMDAATLVENRVLSENISGELRFTCIAGTLRRAGVGVCYHVYAVIVRKVADWVLTLCRHVVVYVCLALQDDSCNDEEHNGEEHRVDRKLCINQFLSLTSLAKILSAFVSIGSISMKLKRSIMATETEPILS